MTFFYTWPHTLLWRYKQAVRPQKQNTTQKNARVRRFIINSNSNLRTIEKRMIFYFTGSFLHIIQHIKGVERRNENKTKNIAIAWSVQTESVHTISRASKCKTIFHFSSLAINSLILFKSLSGSSTKDNSSLYQLPHLLWLSSSGNQRKEMLSKRKHASIVFQSIIQIFVNINTAEGTSPASRRLIPRSPSVYVFRGKVVINLKGVEPSVRFSFM